MEIKQKHEDYAYLLLKGLDFEVETSEGYIPILLRKYAVMKKGNIVFEGDIFGFINFAEEKANG